MYQGKMSISGNSAAPSSEARIISTLFLTKPGFCEFSGVLPALFGVLICLISE